MNSVCWVFVFRSASERDDPCCSAQALPLDGLRFHRPRSRCAPARGQRPCHDAARGREGTSPPASRTNQMAGRGESSGRLAHCPTHWHDNIPMPPKNGGGNGAFPPRSSTVIGSPASRSGIISTNPSCSERSKRSSKEPASPSRPVVTPSGIRLHAFTGAPLRHSDASRAPRPQGRQHHDDLCAWLESRWTRSEQPGGSPLTAGC